MTPREYQDWHKDVSEKVAVFLVQEINRIEAADLASRKFISKIVVKAFWGKAKDLAGNLAPRVLDRVLDCVSSVTLDELMSILGYKRGDG